MKQMHILKTNNSNSSDAAEGNSLFRQLLFKYLPFWPLLAALVVAGAILSFIYLKYTAPVYESTASILVKDEKKGLDDSKMAESFNLFGTTSIVENEMEIISSNSFSTILVEPKRLK